MVDFTSHKTDYAKALFNGESLVIPTMIKLALFTAKPTDLYADFTKTDKSEVASNIGYKRASVAPSIDSFEIVTDKSGITYIRNLTDLNFGTTDTTAWGTISHIAILATVNNQDKLIYLTALPQRWNITADMGTIIIEKNSLNLQII